MGHCWVLYIYCKLSGFLTLTSKASDNSVNCWTHCSGISVHNISRKIFCILHFISVAENLVQIVPNQCSAAAHCGNRWSSVNCLHSFKRDRTGHQSAVNRLQEFLVPCEVVKTLAVHCHSDDCCFPGGHSAGSRPHWVCLQHHATVVTYSGVEICQQISTYRQ